MIKKIDAVSVLQICSAQVVVDLKSAVKELVENSLDAGCQNMEIKFYASGLNGFEVSDDGGGIKEEDFEIIAKRGTTSKIREFEDIYAIKSLGFRGEALSSLCNIANVTIQTKRPDWTTGFQIKFDHLGTLIEKTQIARKNGTQVIVKDLFRDLPVRLIEFKKNCKTQYAKCIQLMQQYAMVADKTRFSILNNQGDGMPFASVLRTNPGPENGFKDNIQSILGKPKFKQLIKYEAEFPKVKISGYVTQTILSGSMSGSKANQNYCFLNNRPIDMPKKMRGLFNEIYRQFNTSMNPILILSLLVEDDNYDINASPDKREVFLKNEKEVLDLMKIHLSDFFENIQRVKAYEQPTNSKVQMDLLDSFKKTSTPQQQEMPTGPENWTLKKRSIDKISNAEATTDEKEEKEESPQKSELAKKILQSQTSKIKEEFSDPQRFSKLDDMLEKFKRNTFDRKFEQSQQDQEMSQPEPKNFNFGNFGYQSQSIKVYEPSNNVKVYEPATPAPEGSQILSQTITHQGLKIVEYGGIGSELRTTAPKRSLNLMQQQDDLKPDFVKTDKDTLRKTAQNYFAKFDEISRKIEQVRSCDDYDRQKLIQGDAILQNYQVKVERQNSRLLSDQNKFEVNCELRDFENQQRLLNARSKVKLQEDSDSDDNQHKELEMINQQAAGLQEEDNEFEEPVKVIQSFKSMKTKIHLHDDEIIEISAKESDDKFIEMDIEKAAEWLKIKQNQTKIELDIADDTDVKNKEQESYANIQITPKQLESMFTKKDFENLEVIGQFNKGFVLAILRDKKDLFIIDQHAADEKYNFEQLSKNTKIHAQDLVCPISLQLSITDGLTVRQHMEIFKLNGFKTEEKENNQFLIKSLPQSKNTTFSVDDFQELIEIVQKNLDQDGSKSLFTDQFLHKEVIRPTKIYHMLASRACRSSIMVGRSLDQKLMRKILTNLSSLQSPWNCPHGRPTLRFLRRMEDIEAIYAQKQKKVLNKNWLNRQNYMLNNRQKPPRLLYIQ